MITRQATESDTDAVLEVWRASRAADGKRPSAAQLADTREALTAGASLLLVVDSGTGVQGFALGTWTGPDQLHLVDLVVAPGGRRMGTGSALIEALADLGYVKGARTLTALPGDERSEAFLTAVGLEPGEPWKGELEPPMRDITAKLEGLRLGQLLKLAGMVDTGSEAKALLETGEVLVNGEVELRRGRQLAADDVVTANDESVRVVPPA